MTATLFLRLLGLMTSLGFGYLVIDYNSPGREVAHAVSGGIRVAGGPLASGMVRFMPASGAMSSGSGAFITNGAYTISEEDGLIAGKYQVQISGIGMEDQIQASRAGASATSKLEDPVPARFNRESEIYVEVTPDGGVLGFDFDLR